MASKCSHCLEESTVSRFTFFELLQVITCSLSPRINEDEISLAMMYLLIHLTVKKLIPAKHFEVRQPLSPHNRLLSIAVPPTLTSIAKYRKTLQRFQVLPTFKKVTRCLLFRCTTLFYCLDF